MKIVLFGLIIVISLFSMISCEREISNNRIGNQKIYFEHAAINFAWGLSYVHWIIDDQGNIRKNKIKDSIIWINLDRLNEYASMFDTVIFKVNKKELDFYLSLIPEVSNEEISEIVQKRADFGLTTFNCFKSVGDSFEVVVLSEMSDLLDRTNLNPNAVKIDKWLKDLHVQMYSN